MREISPSEQLTCDEFLRFASDDARRIAEQIRRDKAEGTRLRPSSTLIDKSVILCAIHRKALIDKIAALVDENLFGRSEMCIQFASLLNHALRHLGQQSRAVLGTAMYFLNGKEMFRWDHAWVRVGEEIVDSNVDSMAENPLVPSGVVACPFWGPIHEIPSDRRLRERHGINPPKDPDVEKIWWPELKDFLEELRIEPTSELKQ